MTDEHAHRIAAELAPLGAGRHAWQAEIGLLFLCFTNRCGSNYLAELLISTGEFNEAGEYFNADTVLQNARTHGLANLRDYVANLPQLAGGCRGWLAAKASIDQLMMLVDAGILDAIPNTHFLLLERQDRLGQAISRCIAAQTGQFMSTQAARHPGVPPAYDRACIDTETARVALANAAFYCFFATNGLTPIHLTYEEIVADPAPAMVRIGAALALPALAADLSRIRIARQADAVNEAWRRRYAGSLA